MRYNRFNQLVGDVVENFTEGKNPKIDTLNGKTVRIEKINPDHFEDLFQVYGELSTEDSLEILGVDLILILLVYILSSTFWRS